jgi:hypothetical protein
VGGCGKLTIFIRNPGPDTDAEEAEEEETDA